MVLIKTVNQFCHNFSHKVCILKCIMEETHKSNFTKVLTESTYSNYVI